MPDDERALLADKAAVAARRLALRAQKLAAAEARFQATVDSGEWEREVARNNALLLGGKAWTKP